MTVPAPTAEFMEAVAALGLECDARDVDRLGAFLERLYRANDTMNLTRVPEASAWIRHVLDSLTLVPWIASIEGAEGAGLRVLDVGSGGGLPGIPIALLLESIAPRAEVHLLEATGKKARFLEGVVGELGLMNVRVINARAETAAHDRGRHRERYDAVVSRAVGPMKVLVELTVPFARPGGFVMCIKGEKAESELAEARDAIGLLGAAFVETRRTLTGTLVRLEKASRTPRTYPRLPGEPARAPIRVGRRRRTKEGA